MPNNIPRDAYLMIIGAGKCETSSLFDYLHWAIQKFVPLLPKNQSFFPKTKAMELR